MPERIGLVAELDLRQFNRNVTTYLNKINQMQTATTNMASAVSTSLTVLDARATRSILHIADAIHLMNMETAAMKRSFSTSTGVSALTNHLKGLTQSANQAAASLANLSRSGSGVRGGLSGNIGGLGGVGGGISNVLGGLGSIGGAIGSTIGGIAGSLASVVRLVTSLAGSVVRSFSGMASSIFRIVGSLAGSVVRSFSGMASSIFRIVGSLAGSVVRSFSGMASSIFRIVGSIATTVGIAFNTVLRTVMRIVGNIVSGVINAFTSILNTVMRIVGSIVSGVVTAFNTILRSVLSIVGNLVSGIVRAFTSLLGTVLNIVQTIVGGIVSAFSSLVGLVANAVSGVASAVVGAFSGVLRAVGGVVSAIANTVIGIFSGMVKTVVSLIEGMVRTVFSAVSGLVSRVGDTLRSIATSILDAYRDLGSKLVQILAVATAAVTGALVLVTREVKKFFSTAISDAAEFQQNMADIQAVLRATADEVRPLGDLIDTLALDPQLVVSTSEASAVVEQLARNGLEMSQILEGAAESAILLANATGGEFAVAADVATMAMQMFGLAASEVNRIADVSQGVINNSRIDLDDWALALGNGGAAAAAVGVKFEDFATVIAGTVNLFHSARQAGTGAMNFFQRLVPITEVAADEMRRVGLFTGLSEEEFRKLGEEVAETEKRIAELDPRMVHYDELIEAHTKHLAELKAQMVPGDNTFFDDQGNFIGTRDMIIELTNAVKDLNQEELVEFGRRVFGNDALETFIGLVQMGKNELAGLEGGFSDLYDELTITNQAMEAAKVRTETLQARWRNLGDIWETIRRKSGEKFTDMLFNLVNRLTALTNLNQDRVIGFFGRMADLLNKLVDAALPWVESQLPGIIDNLESLASWLVETVLQGDKAQYWFERMSPGLRNFMERVFATVRAVKEFAGQVMDLVGSLSRTFRPFIEFTLQNAELKDVLVAAAGAILFNVVPGILRLVGIAFLAVKAVSSIRKAWEEDWGGIRSFFENTWPKIQEPLINFINDILTGKWETAWISMVEVVSTVLQDLEDAVPDFFKEFINLMDDILHGDWEGAWDNVVEIAQKSFDLIKDFLKGLEHPISDFITDVLEGNWPKVWKKIADTAEASFILIVSYLRKLEPHVVNFINNVLKKAWERAWAEIQVGARKGLNEVVSILYEMDTPLSNFTANVLTGRWQEAWDQIKDGASIAYQWVLTSLYGIENPYTTFLADILSGKWDVVWEKIKNGASAAYQWVIDELYALESPYSDFVANVLSGEWEILWQQIKNGATSAYQWVIDQLYAVGSPYTSFLADTLSGEWAKVWQTIKDGAKLAYQWVIDELYAIEKPFTTFLANILAGEWSKAWEQAKNVVRGVRDYIVDWLEGLDSPFTSFIADVLEGNWAGAWENARKSVEKVRDWIVDWLEKFNTPFASFIADVLEGDWAGAWENAKKVVMDVRDAIIAWLADKGPWGTFVTEILEGDWKGAWEIARDFLLGPDGVFTKIQNWLEEKGYWKTFTDAVYLAVGAAGVLAAMLVAAHLRGMVTFAAGIVSASAHLTLFGLQILRFTPLLAAIGVAVAALRVAWEEDFLGIREFTAKILEGIGTIFQVGLLVAGNLVDIFLLAMKEDWAGAWQEIQELSKFAWQIIARAALAGLTAIETFMTTGPGLGIVNWLTATMPTTIVGLQRLFESASSLISTAWQTLTANLTGTQASWAGFFSFLDTLIGTAVGRLGNFIAFVEGAFNFLGNLSNAGWGIHEELNLIAQQEVARSAGNQAEVDRLEGLILESRAKAEQARTGGLDILNNFNSESKKKFAEAWEVSDAEVREKAKQTGQSFIDTVLQVTQDNKKKLEEGLVPNFITLESLNNRFGTQASVIDQFFGGLANATRGQISLADVLRNPASDSDLKKLQAEFEKIFGAFKMPENIIPTDPSRVTSVYESILGAVRQFGVDLTGDFLNKGQEAIENLGEGAESERSTVVSTFESIMADIQAAVNVSIESFKNLGKNIGDALKLGTEESLEIKSPSEVYKRIGMLARQGFQEGWGEDSRWTNSLIRASIAAQQSASSLGSFSNALNTANYSYNNTYNSPVQVGPNYIYTRMDDAEFEYKVKNILSSMRD